MRVGVGAREGASVCEGGGGGVSQISARAQHFRLVHPAKRAKKSDSHCWAPGHPITLSLRLGYATVSETDCFCQPVAARSHAVRGQQLRANCACPCAGGLNQSPSPPRLLRVGPPESESARQVLTRNRRGISPAASRGQCRRKLGSMGVQPGVGGDGGARLGDKTWRSSALQAHRLSVSHSQGGPKKTSTDLWAPWGYFHHWPKTR